MVNSWVKATLWMRRGRLSRAAAVVALIAAASAGAFAITVVLTTSDHHSSIQPQPAVTAHGSVSTSPTLAETTTPTPGDQDASEKRVIHIQHVYESVRRLSALLDTSCLPHCSEGTDFVQMTVGAVRWCGQSVPDSLVNPAFDETNLEIPLVAAYRHACNDLLTARKENGEPIDSASWREITASTLAEIRPALDAYRVEAAKRGVSVATGQP
jgi:hypothetical protein